MTDQEKLRNGQQKFAINLPHSRAYLLAPVDPQETQVNVPQVYTKDQVKSHIDPVIMDVIRK